MLICKRKEVQGKFIPSGIRFPVKTKNNQAVSTMLAHYLTVAIRNLLKNKGQTIISALGVSMGIMSFTICSYIVRTQMTLNNKFPNYKQMASIEASSEKGGGWTVFSLEQIDKISKAGIPGMQAIAAGKVDGKDSYCTVETSDNKIQPYTMNILMANRAFLDIHSIELTEGNKNALFSQPGTIIISETTAKKIFGKQSPLNKTIQRDKSIYTIRGVMKDIPRPNKFARFIPIDIIYCTTEADQAFSGFHAYTLLEPGTSSKEINEYIEQSNYSFKGTDNYGYGTIHDFVPQITLLKDKSWSWDVWIPMGIGFLVLLAGLINFLIFSIGSFYNRTRELSLRKSIGAANRSLFGLLFTELALTLLLATGLSFCFSEIFPSMMATALKSLENEDFFIETSLLISHQLQYLAGILAGCAIIAAAAVFRLRKMPAMKGIRGGNTKGSKHRMRNIMLSVQFFIFLLFSGTAVIFHMQNSCLKKSVFPSFPIEEQERTFEIALTFPALAGIENEVANKLRATNLIEDMLVMGENSFNFNSESIQITPEKAFSANLLNASPNFTSFVHLPIIQGKKTDNPYNVLVNEVFSTFLNKEGNNGSILIGGISYIISGVMPTSTYYLNDNGKSNLVILPVGLPQYCYLKSKPGKEKAVKEHIEKVMRQWIPETLNLNIRQFNQMEPEGQLVLDFLQNISIIFASICLFITTLGIYSAITLDTRRRQKEVAIRKINGASFGTIILLFSKLYLIIFIVTSAFALPITWILADSLFKGFNARFNHSNPLFWIGLLLTVAAIVTATIAYRLYKISRLNPADVIKAE